MIKKLDYSLAPPEFDDVIQVLQHSAETGKYGRNDWLNGISFDSESNYSSSMRHWRDYREGLREDRDNGLHPLLMVACRALMQYTLDVRDKKEDQVSIEEYDREIVIEEEVTSTVPIDIEDDEEYYDVIDTLYRLRDKLSIAQIKNLQLAIFNYEDLNGVPPHKEEVTTKYIEELRKRGYTEESINKVLIALNNAESTKGKSITLDEFNSCNLHYQPCTCLECQGYTL